MIEVPLDDNGTVHSSLDGTKRLSMAAQDVARLRDILQQALAVALQDRGYF